MPPTPRSLAIQPVASAVVALARIFGPAMLKMVDRTAKTMTTTSDSLYLLMAASSWRSVPLKSLARSVVMRPGLGISLTLLLQIQFFLAQLAARNFLIRGAAFHQLGMGALADDAPLIQHQDLVRVQHGGDALRHNNDRGVVGFSLQRTAQRHVGLVVQRREAVIKQIDLRVLGNGAGNRKALLLPTGDVAAALGNRAVEASGLAEMNSVAWAISAACAASRR